MARISDLPPEIIYRVIAHVVASQEEHLAHSSEHARLGLPPPDGPVLAPPSHQTGVYSFMMSSLLHPLFGSPIGSITTPAQRHNQNSNSLSDPPSIGPNGDRSTLQPPRATSSHVANTTASPSGPHCDFPNSSKCSTKTRQHDHTDNQLERLTWPDGLPSDPLLPLALINRVFQQCAQETLFKHVVLQDQWQAYLFHRALAECNQSRLDALTRRAVVTDPKGKRKATSDDAMSNIPGLYLTPNILGSHVRSLRFIWPGIASMGRGGGLLICDTIRSCPNLESIAIGVVLMAHCKEPLFQALASRPAIKEFIILKTTAYDLSKFHWKYDDLIGRLLPQWNSLSTLDVAGLRGSLNGITQSAPFLPPSSCKLSVISLHSPDLTDLELGSLLASSQPTLKALQIINPSHQLSRSGMFRALKECTGPNLETLTLMISQDWHPILYQKTGVAAGSEFFSDPLCNPYILDVLLRAGALQSLQNLRISGPVASSNFFPDLPETIVKLAWEGCSAIQPATFAKFLTSWRQSKSGTEDSHRQASSSDHHSGVGGRVQGLPSLKCCSVGVDAMSWKLADRCDVIDALKERNACFHSIIDEPLFGPGWIRPDDHGFHGDGPEDEDDPDDSFYIGHSDPESNEAHQDRIEEEQDEAPPRELPSPENLNREQEAQPDDSSGPTFLPGFLGFPMAPHGGGGSAGSWFVSSSGLFPPVGLQPSFSTSQHDHFPPNPPMRRPSVRSTTNQNVNQSNIPLDQTAPNSHLPGDRDATSHQSSSRAKSPGLFGPGFNFGKLFDKGS